MKIKSQSRQLVSHGHFLVNGRKVDIPSYLVRNGDKIEISEKSKKPEMFKTMDLDEEMKERNVPEWLKSDRKNGSGDVISSLKQMIWKLEFKQD